MKILSAFLAVGLIAGQTVINTTGVIPTGTFQAPLIVAPPLVLSGQNLSCPGCGGGSSSYIPGLFSQDRPTGVMGTEIHKNLTISPGATVTILNTTAGPGYVSELAVFSTQYNTQITITVDGESTPSIQCKIAELMGDAYLDTQPVFNGNWITTGNNGANQMGGLFRLPIPFGSSIVVTLTNNSGTTANTAEYAVYQTGVANTWQYTQRLHVAVVNAFSIPPNAETDMVNVTPNKRGRLAGFGWIYDGFPGNVSPATAPIEGAFKMYTDGSTQPNYMTSGTEDMFGMGWYFRAYNAFGASGPNNTPAPSNGDNILTISTPYTWGAQKFYIHQPITFNTGLRISWTCGNTTNGVNFTGTCTMKSTVYYYTEN